MTETEAKTETPIEDSKSSRTAKFAQWLMDREEKREKKDSSLEGLIKLNVLVSFLTLGLVGGFETVQLAVSLIPYLG